MTTTKKRIPRGVFIIKRYFSSTIEKPHILWLSNREFWVHEVKKRLFHPCRTYERALLVRGSIIAGETRERADINS